MHLDNFFFSHFLLVYLFMLNFLEKVYELTLVDVENCVLGKKVILTVNLDENY